MSAGTFSKLQGLNKEKLRKIYRFLGPRIIVLGGLSTVCGILLFLTEFAFAYAMQIFLVAIGLSSIDQLGFKTEIAILQPQNGLILIFVLVVLRAFFTWMQNYVQYASFSRFVFWSRQRLLSWLFRSSSASHSDTIHQFTDQTYNAGVGVLHLQQLISQACICFLLGGALVWLFPGPSFIGFALLAVLMIPLKVLFKRIEKHGEQFQALTKRAIGQISLALRNLAFIRIYSLEAKEEERQRKGIENALDQQLKFYSLSGSSAVIPQVLGIGVVIFLIMSIQTEGIAKPSILITYLYLFFRFVQTGATVAQTMTNFIFHMPFLERTAQWWAAYSNESAITKQIENPPKKLEGSAPFGWSVKNLNFSYSKNDENIFKNLSIEIKPGSALGIIGPSGSGKSTLLFLLLAQLKANAGTIQILSKDGRSFDLESHKSGLLQHVGYVGTEAFLFDGTIRDNLLYGIERKPQEDEIKKALELAECKFVEDFDQGLEHKITDQGSGISAGQKQRLSLARAILRKPSILVLDEATANLDLETEASLIKTLKSLKGQWTMLVVTHRDTMLALTDSVLKLDGRD